MKKGLVPAEKSFYSFYTPIGQICVAEDGKGISDLFFGRREKPAYAKEQPTPLLLKAETQLQEYFNGERKAFELPLSLHGTPFQVSVWEALLTIPYGETRSYKQIAEQIGNPKACRAVGLGNNRNPVGIIVPCHRVIGSDGSLVGYGGGLPVKQYLLTLERKYLIPQDENRPDDPVESLDDLAKEIW